MILHVVWAVVRSLVAIPAGLLPWRYWRRFEGVPIARMAPLSGLVTLVAGATVGVRGFAAYARAAADAVVNATLHIAAHQLRNGVSKGAWISSTTMQHISALSIFAFILFTPLGWLAAYLAVTGAWRAVAGWVEDPFGDPILTGADALATRTWRRARSWRTRRARERQEGPEVPDRLFTGRWAGLAGVDYVVVASRRKAEWTAGTFIITREKWFRLGEPYDLRLPDGLRTVYPLTELKTPEVLRKGVAYDLPQETVDRGS